MDKVIFTPRLKLTLVTEAAKESPEFEWLQVIWTDEKATWWSIAGRAQTTEDIERVLLRDLPNNLDDTSHYRVVYAVHKLLESQSTTTATTTTEPPPTPTSEFIGILTLKPITPKTGLPLPANLTTPTSSTTTTTLEIEVAYMFLPASWNHGHATEAIQALFAACVRARSFWAPYQKLYVRAIVNALNPASARVMEKVGMERKGVFEWKGKATFLAGEWRVRDDLVIFGKYLFD